MSFQIEVVHARQVLDSRGNPTVEADVVLGCGVIGRAAVPSGASTGEHEAVELRDGDKAVYMGKGVGQAVANVIERIAPAIEGMDAREQEEIDAVMAEIDGTPNKGGLGANAILAVSMAAAKAAAEASGLPLYRYLGGSAAKTLPVPMMNILNGGKHADNTVDFQEFMIQPWGFDDFGEALRAGVEIYHTLKKVLTDRGMSTAVGDEGGLCAQPQEQRGRPLKIIEEATVKKAGYKWGEQIFVALDPATSELWNEAAEEGKTGLQVLQVHQGNRLERRDDRHVGGVVPEVPDPLDRGRPGGERLGGLGEAHGKLGDKVQLVGDDLFVTNTKFLARGIAENCANAILVKVNQIGTLS